MQQTETMHRRLKVLLVVLTILVVGIVLMGLWKMNQDGRNSDIVTDQAKKDTQSQKVMHEQSRTLDSIRSEVVSEPGVRSGDSPEQQLKDIDAAKGRAGKSAAGGSIEDQSRALDEARAEYK